MKKPYTVSEMIIEKITDFKTSTWSGGTTTELYIYPKEADYLQRDFLFRLSSATVEIEESDFSNLANYQRFIALLKGELQISHENREFYKELSLDEIYAFDGGVKTKSKGRCRDFNFMLKKGHHAEVENTWLKEGERLIIETNSQEIVWFFIYGSNGNIWVRINSDLSENSALSAMTLFVLTPHKKDVSLKEIQISADSSLRVFWGKVAL